MATMKAVRIHAYGGPEVLHHEENVPLPTLEPKDILIRVRAAAVNPVDWKIREGYLQGALRHTLPLILGWDVSGEVVEVDPAVTEFKVGDEVYARPDIERDGGYAEYIAVKASDAARKPTRLDHLHAAAVPLAALTAWQSLVDAAQLQAGQTVLIHAAAGGVGLIACQWARALGATVIGTVGSPAKAELARAHGCDHVIDYRIEDFVTRVRDITGGAGVAVVYDGVGKDTFAGSLDCLRPLGTMVTFGNASGPVPPIDPLLLSAKGSLFLTRPTIVHYTARRDDLEALGTALFDQVCSGRVRVEIHQRYALKDAAQAHRDLEARRTTGSTILLP